jgi:uncharacterized protein
VTAALALARGEPRLRIGALEGVPHHTGALWLPDARALLVADLHLEKASAYAARGVFLPPYDTRATLVSLALAIATFNPARVIALGDSFHDAGGAARLADEDRAALAACQAGRDWLWLLGNHDPRPPAGIGGDVAMEERTGGVVLRHAPLAAETAPEIAGHLHPAAKVRLRGKSVRRRCFAHDGRRLVMPAFGALTGGLSVRDAAFRPLFPDGLDAMMLGDGRVFSINGALLLPD